jgi:catechol 2,3-dioxygenase-like lactoylglutathione lyase family enzyme
MKFLLPKLPIFLALALACAVSAPAQLKPPNAIGVSMGAVHLTVRDVDANIAFFKLLGGTPVKNGPLQLMEFPGMYVGLEKGEPTGGSIGSIVNHFGFQVRSMKDWLPKWQAAGIKIEPQTRPTQAYLLTPDDVRIEILEEPTLPTPIAGHHIHFFTQDVPGMQAWYVKTFGAIPGTRAQFQTADLPGINLTFTAAPPPSDPTSGRALSSIVFEVKDLKAFLATLKSAGIKIDEPYKKIPHSSIAKATITDPWGTTIELTEGLASTK